MCSIPGLGKSPGEGKGYPLQYSGLENSMDCIVHGVAKSQRRLSNFHFHLVLCEECVWDGKSGTRESVRGYCSSPGQKGGWRGRAWKDLPMNWIWVIKNDSKDYPSFGSEPLAGSRCQFTKMRDAKAGTDWVGVWVWELSEGQAGAQVESGMYRFGSQERNQDWR